MGTNFYRAINRALTLNLEDSYKHFLKTIFHAKPSKEYKVISNIVYRCLAIKKQNPGDFTNLRTRCEYVVGVSYYWPAFTSTSKDEAASIAGFLENELKNDEYDYFLFKIHLNLLNISNKFDISTISRYKKENEILLLPYFYFKVLRNEPIKIKNKNVCVIEIKEYSEDRVPRRVLWFDPNIEEKENIKYQKIIENTFGLVSFLRFKNFKEAENFVKKHHEFNYFVISCGSRGKEFFDLIKEEENVKYLAVFCYDKLKHQKWFNQHPSFYLNSFILLILFIN